MKWSRARVSVLIGGVALAVASCSSGSDNVETVGESTSSEAPAGEPSATESRSSDVPDSDASVAAAPASESPSSDATDVAPAPIDDTVVVPEALQFTNAAVGGGEIDAASFAGKPVVFWFWAPT